MNRAAVDSVRASCRRFVANIRSSKAMAFAVTLCLATAALVWLGYNATREAQQSRRLLLERRVAEQLALLSAGLTQDMRGAHATVLTPITRAQLAQDPPYDLAEGFARGFARFPYPEFFFAWRAPGAGGAPVTYAFTRADRPPSWVEAEASGGPYPVDVARNPPVVEQVVSAARLHAQQQRPFALFSSAIAGVPHQVIVNFVYSGPDPGQLSALVGFAVNLAWVREAYFDELAFQIARIGGVPEEMSLEILDDAGRIVASTGGRHAQIAPAERPFPLIFFDRALLGTLPVLQRGEIETWTARVGIAGASSIATDRGSIDSTFALMSFAAVATVAGLIVTARGVRVAAELAVMKSDFVSSVTHELKMPVAVIRLIADTLAKGRYDSPSTVQEYAGLLGRETKNLGRLVDNLLAYARFSDFRHAYTLEPLDVGDLVDDAVEHFRAALLEGHFDVEVEVPPDLPPILADRIAALHAIENVIDNAIKYSDQQRRVEIRARLSDRAVAITVADRGVGIRDTEIPRVGEKFFRGRDVKRGGSGLGLAIVRQILEAHGGRFSIQSSEGQGTAVEIQFPVAGVSA